MALTFRAPRRTREVPHSSKPRFGAIPSSFAALASEGNARSLWWLLFVAPLAMVALVTTMLLHIESKADALALREYQAQQLLLVDHAAARLATTLDVARRELARVAERPDAVRSFARHVGVPAAIYRVSSTNEPLRLSSTGVDDPRGSHQLTVSHSLGEDDALVAVLDAAAIHRSQLAALAPDHDGYVWVLDDWNTIVSAPDPTHVGTRPFDALRSEVARELDPMLAGMRADRRGTGAYDWWTEEHVERRLAAFAPVPGYPELSVAHSVSATSVSARTHDLHQSSRTLVVVLLALLALLGVAVAWLVRRDARRRLSRALQLGQYTLEERIGEGGMGVVYRARHAFLRRPTAIKLIAPNKVGEAALERFEAEAQALASLRHPSIVTLYDYGRSGDGVLYYAMELLDGYDLDAIVSHEGAQPIERVVHWLEQILGALAEAHALGLVHRDVKPANVMTCRQAGALDVAKLLDFGLVAERGVGSRDGTRRIFGTPLYLAPEAIVKPFEVDPRADLYALGATAFELLTGRPPFDFPDASTALQHPLVEPPPTPSSFRPAISPALEAWVLRLLEKDPRRRFVDAQAALAALREVGGERWSQVRAGAWWSAKEPSPARSPELASAETLDASLVVG